MGSSEYLRALEDLEARKCETCGGLGTVDDAEPGDISFRTFQCPDCKGSGFARMVLPDEVTPSIKNQVEEYQHAQEKSNET